MSKGPTDKMKSYVKSLAKKAGRTIGDPAGMTYDECKALIEELKAVVDGPKDDTPVAEPVVVVEEVPVVVEEPVEIIPVVEEVEDVVEVVEDIVDDVVEVVDDVVIDESPVVEDVQPEQPKKMATEGKKNLIRSLIKQGKVKAITEDQVDTLTDRGASRIIYAILGPYKKKEAK